MHGFIDDLLEGLPAVPSGDPDSTMLHGLREALDRLNGELEFIRNLANASTQIDALEKTIADMRETTDKVEAMQASTITKMEGCTLKAEEQESVIKSIGGRMTVVESGAWQASARPSGKGAGHDDCQAILKIYQSGLVAPAAHLINESMCSFVA